LQKAEPDDQRMNVLMGMSHYGLAHYAAAIPVSKAGRQDDDPKKPDLAF